MSDNLKDLIPEGHEIVTDDDDMEGLDEDGKKIYKEIMDDYEKYLDGVTEKILNGEDPGTKEGKYYDTGDPEMDAELNALQEVVEGKPVSEWGKKEFDAWNKKHYLLQEVRRRFEKAILDHINEID